jgi:hypothetical protein
VRAHHVGQHAVDGGLQGADAQVSELAHRRTARGGERALAVHEAELSLLEQGISCVGQLNWAT